MPSLSTLYISLMFINSDKFDIYIYFNEILLNLILWSKNFFLILLIYSCKSYIFFEYLQKINLRKWQYLACKIISIYLFYYYSVKIIFIIMRINSPEAKSAKIH